MVAALQPDASVREVAPADVAIDLPRGTLRLGSLPAGVVRAVRTLERGRAVKLLEDELLETDGLEALARWYTVVARLEAAAAIRYIVRHDGRTVATFTPAAEGRASIVDHAVGRMLLSRFAHLRRDGDALLLDSPLSRGRLEITDPQAAAVVGAVHVPSSAAEVAAKLNMPDVWIGPLLSLLVAAGLVLLVDDEGRTAEDRSAAATSWEFADLVLHGRSRTSRADLRVGGTYRFEGELEPLPPFKPRVSSDTIALARPDIAALSAHDEPFTRVMERRRSVRDHGTTPISSSQLGEFLFRTVRARPSRDVDAQRDESSEAGSVRRRLYPGGGACHPLEIYALVSRCDGLAAGVYHYDPDGHVLEVLPDAGVDAEPLARQVSVPMANGAVPQVVLVLTARFRRLSWKYEGNAYALLLQEVGVVYESMYLVATAMDLAPCAVGGGDAARFAAVIGTDPLEEASVGAFVLGSAPGR